MCSLMFVVMDLDQVFTRIQIVGCGIIEGYNL